jgi:hypothetical protein
MDRGSVRAEIGRLARAGDPEALRAFADALPSTEAYAYERHRARAFALALTGATDSARTSLNLAAAAEPPTTGMLAEDTAQLHLLLGDVPGTLAALELALGSELPLQEPASLLAQAVRVAPAEWRRAASLAVTAGPRSVAAVAGASIEAYSDRGPFRVGVLLAGLATVVVVLLGLPALLSDGPEREPPGVTAPEATAQPHDVVVAAPPPRSVRPLPSAASRRSPAPPASRAPRLVAATSAPARPSPREAPRPVPSPEEPASPPPAPTAPAPAPAPAPPAPAAAEAALAAVPAPAAAPPPAPAAAKPPHNGRALALGQKRERGEHPPPPPPKESPAPVDAAVPQPGAVPPEPKEHGNGKGPKP